MTYRALLFDFDGTLADSFPMFLRAYAELAERHGLARLDTEQIEQMRGIHPRQMIERIGMPLWKLPFVTRDFVAYMRAHVGEVPLFPGVPEALRQLADAGVALAVVTSNAEDTVRRILGPDLLRTLRHIETGMSMFGKAPRIRRALDHLKPDGPALYIGDQLSDQEGAHQADVPFGAVCWGYGDPDALRRARPDRLFERVEELAQLGG